jgi:RNA polymerase sigma-70 factor (ECF subfamily)
MTRGATTFTRRVIAAARRIPPGRVATYGDLARLAGQPGAARAVGNIMRNGGVPGLPYHRVIAAGGRVGGYGGNEALKEALLRSEGLTVTRCPRPAGQRQPTMPPSNLPEADRAAEAALVGRVRAGDMAAFEEMYRRHAPRVYSLAVRLSGSTAEAEDLMQEVFLLVYRKLEGFKGEAALGTWIYRLATNCCLDFLRSRRHREDRATGGLDESGDVPRAPAPALRVERLDLERAIAQLPAGYRAAFVLHDVEGYDHAEVGRLLDIAEGTSKSQVHKARLRLRTLLRPAPTRDR